MRLQRYILTGIATVIPVAVTWVVFDFVLGLLARIGFPAVVFLSRTFRASEYVVAEWLLNPLAQSILAVLLTLAGFYLLGLATTAVLGRKLIALFELILQRLPLVQTIYGSTKRLLEVLRSKPAHIQRVVLISFPTRDMKALGFITRVLKDCDTGEDLAAVYVPTTPNPTSGYMEIVPLRNVVQTDMSFDEAMSFIITGGAVGPDSIRYSCPSEHVAGPQSEP